MYILAKLQYVSKPLIPSTVCRAIFWHYWSHRITQNDICAGDAYSGDNTENICYGDYGGPLVPVGREDDSAVVIGVASVGMARSVNCDAEGFPDIYTYVPNYIPWIQSLMGP